ncbi:Protein of unknown function [Peptoclostridium litorale DSM 5388]|uniref:DUF3793 family protein n=1 Tax=Peptoclostridium litorale DSM 5388 TaxID=1121324 RepID=A0A069RHV4_PEPLI|nr:DUF3793 family protein [Peptoclostridium litorale]KDR96571.1 hypothetical protein CLIT_2c01770 [Peptoclostridium litorale DSM 5388]SIN68988.1 Protein of unknown function [Peptoclostridium litorale DSM 5388]
METKSCGLNCSTCFKSSEDFFVRAFVSNLGPVIAGVKPIHLFSISPSDKLKDEKIEKIHHYFSRCSKISYDIFECSDKSTKILFYNENTLDYVLSDQKNQRFLKSHGYPLNYTMDAYLGHLIEKMRECIDAHEMGIFFGYPLKDVMGFMGNPKLKFTKMAGWRVYGDPKKSDEVFANFNSAKLWFMKMLEQNSPRELLVQNSKLVYNS